MLFRPGGHRKSVQGHSRRRPMRRRRLCRDCGRPASRITGFARHHRDVCSTVRSGTLAPSIVSDAAKESKSDEVEARVLAIAHSILSLSGNHPTELTRRLAPFLQPLQKSLEGLSRGIICPHDFSQHILLKGDISEFNGHSDVTCDLSDLDAIAHGMPSGQSRLVGISDSGLLDCRGNTLPAPASVWRASTRRNVVRIARTACSSRTTAAPPPSASWSS